jgi:transcriptional regulator with XRE-family HTH domain
MKENFPDMIRTARTKAGLTTRQLSDELTVRGVKASVTLINQVEHATTKPTFDFAYYAAQETDLDPEAALRAAFLYRVKWSIDREKEALRNVAEKEGLGDEAVNRITSLRGLK